MKMEIKRLLLFCFLIIGLNDCKAQSVASFSSFNMSEANSLGYVEWYNSNVSASTKTDTLSLLEIPANSELAFVHIRPTKGAITIRKAGGREYIIDENRIWLETALFDNKGRLIRPIDPMVVSGYDFEVKMDACRGCAIKTKSDL